MKTIEIQAQFLPSKKEMIRIGREMVLKNLEEIKESIDRPNEQILLIQKFYSDSIAVVIASRSERKEEGEEFLDHLLEEVKKDIKERLNIIYQYKDRVGGN